MSRRFDPSVLLCRRGDRGDCLTQPQIESVRRIAAAGFQPSSAAHSDGWAQWILNLDPNAPSQLTFAVQAVRHLFRNDPGWTIDRFDVRADGAPPALRSLLDADAVDLSPFRARGGRLISYFGWADPLLSPTEGLAYYRRVAAQMGAGATRTFYRLFMVPGMGHCQGGLGPTAFGQSAPAPALRPDPRHDVRRALETWVEQGIAPDQLIASGDGATGVLRPVE